MPRSALTHGFGRHPLLTSEKGRLGKSMIRRDTYRVTAPCFLGRECPDCVYGNHGACGESVCPHSIRRGSITLHLTEDIAVDEVGDKMNVSRKVLGKHYDRRSDEVKLEQRRAYLEKI